MIPTPTIANAANVPLNVQTGTIPNVGGGLLDWLQPMVFTQVMKFTVAYQLIETITNVNFWGLAQPTQGRKLNIESHGQRKWAYITITAQDSPEGALISLKPDDVVTYLNIQYRVIGLKNYAIFGYLELDLVNDYTGSGPGPGQVAS